MVRYIKTPIDRFNLMIMHWLSFDLSARIIESLTGDEIAVLIDERATRIVGKVRSTGYLFDRLAEIDR
ncbi:hypothetical protein MPC4_80149 [Methylocella tundrae]|uniref:Uncharacterized protein n=1 Tax=Methylocella tundrae TaxID=227605 RepID=A0A8B6MD76_METTU|nr:hypothetical protein [Methylocella tundrae]VTZ27912.1 hypothetical protein MPC1_70022 [Methylocella tundrae]VTZ52478.1 hypothetical protein MPC4_80149 [Methylocella tundrae]